MSLQNCIENRPAVGEPGFTQTFEDFVRGTRPEEGTCLDFVEEIKCTSNDDCVTLTNSSSSECEFEDWTGGVVISDPNDEEQCRNARSSLFFDEDYADDVDVCEEFQFFLCDGIFAEDLAAKPEEPTFESVSYTPPV